MSKKFTHFIKENVAPKGTKQIGVYNENGEKVGVIPLGFLSPPKENKLYSFCAVSDVHVTYNTGSEDFQRALTYVENNDIDFTVVNGDLTGNGNDEQMTQYKNLVSTYAKTKPVYALGGNHETVQRYMTSERIQKYTGNTMNYYIEKGDDVFIFVSHWGAYGGDGIGWKSSEFISREELQWLYETLEANRNKRCFVFNHVYPYEDRVGDACRYYDGRYWLTTDGGIGEAFINLLKHYKNTVLFHGHSHLRFYLQELDEKANYSSTVGYRSVHIPSLSVPRDSVDGTTSYIYAESEGYIVDVYDNYIILNGRDFIDNEKDGHEIPIATYKIDTTLVGVKANTFVDSTGTITV